jgi:hypothetical protein
LNSLFGESREGKRERGREGEGGRKGKRKIVTEMI